MTYCHWNDEPRCDLHCYNGRDGSYVIHVRGLIRPRALPIVDTSSAKARQETTQLRWIAERDPSNQPVPMGLPFAGQMLSFETLQSMRDQMAVLCELGYQVPNTVLDSIDAEIDDLRLFRLTKEIVG